MTPFEAYRMYVAIKLHFKDKKYDYFKFNGHVKLSQTSFESRKDFYFFKRISKIYKEEDYLHLLISNLIDTPDKWIGEIISADGRANLATWKKTYQSLEYTFVQDVTKLKELIDFAKIPSFDCLFTMDSTTQNWPMLVDLVMSKEISLETFIIMNKVLRFMPRFNKMVTDELVWSAFSHMCFKYDPFIRINIEEYKHIMKNIILDNFSSKNVESKKQI